MELSSERNSSTNWPFDELLVDSNIPWNMLRRRMKHDETRRMVMTILLVIDS